MRKVLGALVGALGLILAAVVALWARPPELIRVGSGYAAKIVCSNAFLTGRDPFEVLRTDVQAPGHPLLKLMRVRVDRRTGLVRAGLFGFMGDGLAVRNGDAGCTLVPDGKLATALRAGAGGAPSMLAAPPTADDPRPVAMPLQALIADATLAGPGMRAVVILKNGQIVAEAYADGFGPHTRQLGWSMTKTVTAGLIGLLVKDGRLSLEQTAGWPAGDGRERIRVADLMSMSSGLEFNEGYGSVSDVTRMLYLEADMSAFARAKPLAHPVGTVWSYSSGTAVILSRLFQDALGPGADAAGFVRTRLFEPLGMTSAVIELDEAGTLTGSSYMYATPRDWARFGQLLLQGGLWNGRELLPQGYVSMMASAAPASGGEYGRGMVWRWVTHSDIPGENPDAAYGIPSDTFWMAGHDGQYVAIIPSRGLVIVRMGLTPAREHYRVEPLVRAVLDAADRAGGAALTPASGDPGGNPR
jgi:CubicO group peptidase (beta-lactamase class C family)